MEEFFDELEKFSVVCVENWKWTLVILLIPFIIDFIMCVACLMSMAH